MSNFLKLSNRLININHILEIVIKPNKYHIHLMNHNIHGVFIFASGAIESVHNEITICEKNNPHDYLKISDWIKEKL